jgi:hypothetical protein
MVGTSRPQRIPILQREVDADAAGDGQQVDRRHWWSRRWRRIHAYGVLESLFGQDVGGLQVVLDHLDDAAAGQLRHHPAATSRRPGIAALPESAMPRASAIEAIVEAVPIVLQVPVERAHRGFRLQELGLRHLAGLHGLRELPKVRARPDALAAEIAVEHRTAGYDDRGEVGGCRRHQQRRRGLVAAHEKDRAVDRLPAHLPLRQRARRGCGYIIAVGRNVFSEAENTGISTGNPPASHTPAFTFSASSRRWPLQGVRSDQVLRMPITGRPSKRSCGIVPDSSASRDDRSCRARCRRTSAGTSACGARGPVAEAVMMFFVCPVSSARSSRPRLTAS